MIKQPTGSWSLPSVHSMRSTSRSPKPRRACQQLRTASALVARFNSHTCCLLKSRGPSCHALSTGADASPRQRSTSLLS